MSIKTGLLKLVDNFFGRFLTSCLPPPNSLIPGSLSSILLIRPGGIGDALLLSMTVAALHKYFRDATIDVLAEKRNARAFALMPGIREVFTYDDPSDLCTILRRRYDIAVDTEQWHRLSAVVCRLVRSSIKVGFDTNERRRMFTHPIPYLPDQFESESFFNLLGPLGIADDFLTNNDLLIVPEAAQQKVASILSDIKQLPLLALFPAASIQEKRWDPRKFREFVWWCNENELQVVILGGKHDRALGEYVAARNALNLAGLTSLEESAAVMEKAAIVVSGDSGMLHLAFCLDRPTVSIFGPSNDIKWAPRGSKHIIVKRGLSCSPCSRFGNTPKCLKGVQCLQEISVEEVIAATEALLARNMQGNRF
ncbi:glycosyltransferase family 9 protein [Desulfuromonas sp. TF]|uniref:glycosyltransferase family 9 protein n=1 Tax=Desulfuromonas sp. TF TaxID=1232410 RepID=UPI0004271E82|nr:glycosyltransferase family 9 protein [Desulfuromonas sp. TF]